MFRDFSLELETHQFWNGQVFVDDIKQAKYLSEKELKDYINSQPYMVLVYPTDKGMIVYKHK